MKKKIILLAALLSVSTTTTAFAGQKVTLRDGSVIELDERIQIEDYSEGEDFFANMPRTHGNIGEITPDWEWPNLRLKRDVKICAASVSLYSWQVPVCTGSVGATIAACTATYGIIEGCITGK